MGIQPQTTRMTTLEGYNWFFIMCTWEPQDDRAALEKWVEVYNFLVTKQTAAKEYDPRGDIADQGLTALNLIGKRRFVIAGQAKSNKALQKLSSMITLESPIKVDVCAATNVYEFGDVNKDVLGIKGVDGAAGTLITS